MLCTFNQKNRKVMCWICVSQVDQQDLETANKSQELKGHSGLMINSLEKNKQEKRH